MQLMSRRTVSLSILSTSLLMGCATAESGTKDTSDWTHALNAIEKARSGRIGVAALDLESGQMLGHRHTERFAMCSAFKWILGGVVLLRVDKGEEDLSRQINITEADMIFHAPTSKAAVGSSLSIEMLCAATIKNSDNPAANLLLDTMGGPQGFTQMLRDIGDETTRLDRYELELNENRPGDPRDTTTPEAMVRLMQRFVFGDILKPASRTFLKDWMLAATTGQKRLKAGVPEGWSLGHKTGTSQQNASNDVGFMLPPDTMDRAPILIISFSDGPAPFSAESDLAHANVAAEVFRQFT